MYHIFSSGTGRLQKKRRICEFLYVKNCLKTLDFITCTCITFVNVCLVLLINSKPNDFAQHSLHTVEKPEQNKLHNTIYHYIVFYVN